MKHLKEIKLLISLFIQKVMCIIIGKQSAIKNPYTEEIVKLSDVTSGKFKYAFDYHRALKKDIGNTIFFINPELKN